MRTRGTIAGIILGLLLFQIAFAQSQSQEIDAKRFFELQRKQEIGRELTVEEAAYVERVLRLLELRSQPRENLTPAQRQSLQEFGESRQKWNQDFRKENPPRESTGLVPLPDLAGGQHKGVEGGLYPGGRNRPPDEHLQAGLRQAALVTPRNESGDPVSDGKIVLLSIGMSNTTMEFGAFQEMADGAGGLNPDLVIVDGAQGGQAAEVTADPEARYWEVLDERLGEAGVSRAQVQAVWIKQATIRPLLPFPDEAKLLQRYLVDTVHVLADRFPNLRLTYFSSRIYAGYATSQLNPEPHAYESGFAVKWLIADQIEGDPDLSYDQERGPARSPWLAWGPYLWADGTKGRSDGLKYAVTDLRSDDGTHPSATGMQIVATQLLDFFSSDPTTRPWFMAR